MLAVGLNDLYNLIMAGIIDTVKYLCWHALLSAQPIHVCWFKI